MANYNTHVGKIYKIEKLKARCALAHKSIGGTEITEGAGGTGNQVGVPPLQHATKNSFILFIRNNSQIQNYISSSWINV